MHIVIDAGRYRMADVPPIVQELEEGTTLRVEDGCLCLYGPKGEFHLRFIISPTDEEVFFVNDSDKGEAYNRHIRIEGRK